MVPSHQPQTGATVRLRNRHTGGLTTVRVVRASANRIDVEWPHWVTPRRRERGTDGVYFVNDYAAESTGVFYPEAGR
jgi:hypothetical protein